VEPLSRILLHTSNLSNNVQPPANSCTGQCQYWAPPLEVGDKL